jgi:N-acetyl-alpha-D-muramate 1-phosphate uridylyltransferase
MDAMIFAAGLGTRLRPLTDTIPKPLIEVGGVPMLERVARRLIDAGADRLVINAHHHADQIEAFVRSRNGFGVDTRVSHEEGEPQETGGALRHARHLFRREAPFFLHNSDVLSDAPLETLYAAHGDDAIATLAVLPNATQRYLLFDDDGLAGYADRHSGVEHLVRETRGALRRHDFTGIHVASPVLFDELPPEGAFSLMSLYLRFAREGRSVRPFVLGECRWIDIGSPESLATARRWFTDAA